MSMRFSTVCNLLSDLELLYVREPPLLPSALQARSERLIEEWFRVHRHVIDDPDTDLTALLSTFLPAKRSDRVYRLQPARLCTVLGRCFRLGRSRLADLERWKTPDCGTLAECVERVQSQAPNRVSKSTSVTVNEVDAALARISARYSGTASQSRTHEDESAVVIEKLLGRLYNRLSPRDCKWLTRLILKDFAPISLDEYVVISRTHRLLPLILRVRATLDGAVSALHELGLRNVQSFDSAESREHCIATLRKMSPKPGTFAGRPIYYFGRSVKYLVHAAEGRQMCLERKYDGEYCQVHIDLRNRGHEIQLFSKSGKDSTKDRKGLHYAIKRSLRIGRSDCPFRETAIIEGELLVWSDEYRTILPFHKIRNHVRRTGRLVGTVKDDPPPPSEHLMIMFYDVLRVDSEPLIHKNYTIRRRTLLGLIDEVTGLAKVAPSQIIDFSARGSTENLLQCLSEAFARKWEGYMMKPVNEPYVNMGEQGSGKFYASFFKIKKDYITGFGDTADMLIVGASYDAATAARLHVPHIPWTHFHLACRPVTRLSSTPRPVYRVLHVTSEGLDADTMLKLCRDLKFRAAAAESPEARQICDIEWPYDTRQQMPVGRVVLREPIVVEMKGYGFEVPGNENYCALRFPKFVKIKWDVDPDDAVTFQKLQDLAHEAMTVPKEDNLTDDVANYRKRLERSETRSGAGSHWWEDTDSRSVSPIQKGIPVYEDEENTLSYDAHPMPGKSPLVILQNLENLPDTHQGSLPLVRKIPNGAEDYASRIRRIAARRKRKRPETPSQQDTTSQGQDTEAASQVSIPLPKRQTQQIRAHVPAYDANEVPPRASPAKGREHELNASSSDCETPVHPVFDGSSFIQGNTVSPPRNQRAAANLITSSAPETRRSNRSTPKPAGSTSVSSPSSSPPKPKPTDCTIIIGKGVPNKQIERYRTTYPTVQWMPEGLDLKSIAGQEAMLLLEPADPSSALWLHDTISKANLQDSVSVSVWDWRVMQWMCTLGPDNACTARKDMERQQRRNYIGRVEIRNGQPHVTWANGDTIPQTRPIEAPTSSINADCIISRKTRA